MESERGRDSFLYATASFFLARHLLVGYEQDADQQLLYRPLLQMGIFAVALATFVIDSYKSLLIRLGGKRRRPSLTNMPANRWSLQRNQVPITAALTSISQQTATPASVVWVSSFWFLSLVSSFLLSTRDAPATLGPQIPPSYAISGRDP